MTRRWHPALGSPDPADGWISPDTIARQHREEAEEIGFRAMVARRNRFQRAVAQLDDDDPEEISRLWEASDGADETTSTE